MPDERALPRAGCLSLLNGVNQLLPQEQEGNYLLTGG